MKLFEDEQILFRLDKVDVVLTTHRVRRGDKADFTSILLEQVCSVAVERTARPFMLVLGIVCLVVAVAFAIAASNSFSRADDYQVGMVVAGILGLACFLIYYITRFSIVKIASAGDSIEFKASRIGQAKVLDFVNALELAKSDRHALRKPRVVVG